MAVSAEDLVLLRRKLGLLNYADPFDDSSGQLVAKLTDDLIHATDSYRQLKLAHDARDRELRQYHAKVEELVKEKSNLAGDNAQLKLQVLRFKELLTVRGEERGQAEDSWRQQVDHLDAARHSLMDQLSSLEREHTALKQQMGSSDAGGVLEEEAMPPTPKPSFKTSADALAVAQSRIDSLEKELRQAQAAAGAANSQSAELQAGIQHREQEVMQLVKELRNHSSAGKGVEDVGGREMELRQQVAGLKADLMSALAERAGGGGPDADVCLLEVLELKQELQADAQGAAALKSLLHRAQRGRSRAQAREAGLKAQVEMLRRELADVKVARQRLQAKCVAKENRLPRRPAKPVAEPSERSSMEPEAQEQANMAGHELQPAKVDEPAPRCRPAEPPRRQASGSLAAELEAPRNGPDPADAAAPRMVEAGTQTPAEGLSLQLAEASTQTEAVLPAEQQVQQLRAELAGLKPVLAAERGREAAAAAQLEGSKREVDALRSLALRGDTTTQELLGQLKGLVKRTQIAEARAAALTARAGDDGRSIEHLRASDRQLRQEVERLLHEAVLASARQDAQAAELGLMTQDASERERQLSELAGYAKQLEAQVASLEGTLQAKNNMLAELEHQLEAARQECGAMQTELAAAAEDMEVLVADSRAAGCAAAAAAAQSEQAKARAADLEACVSTQRRLQMQQSEELHALKQDHEELRAECQRRQEEIGRLQAALSEHGRQLEAGVSVTRSRCQELQEQADRWQKRCEASEARCLGMADDVSAAQQESRQAQQRCRALQQQLADMQDALVMAGHAEERDGEAESLVEMRARLEEAEQDAARALELLTRLEAERSALERENAALRDAAPRRASEYQVGESAAIQQLEQLRGQLERERQQRSQAEADFEELLGTIEELKG